ncbi:MAG TPA: serine/threonine-protein kinase [Kofleriaceae bacterium]|nr:serine/threonine-protein kinase [Kofleriaceae bacterium]
MEQATAQDRLLGAKVGNYEVKQKLGEGGMGAVYLAVHPNIGKRVALKVLHPEFSSNEEVIGRFFNEAKAVNDIQHPNIVDIIDYGEMPSASGSGQRVVYFIMEFLAGDSLAKLIHDHAPLAPERAQLIALQIADALGASHRHGIVHRDLKPDNVMISARRDGRDFVKVLDFGIAKLTGDNPGSRRTRTGIVMGTPAYMSPEQCEGRGLVDHRTDLYALGILLYEMLTGQVPFRGEGYGEVLVQHMTHLPRKPSTIRGVIPPHLEAVCLKALEKRPGDRFPDMDLFMRALQDPVGFVESHGGLDGFLTYGRSHPGYEQAPPYLTSQPSPYPGITLASEAGQHGDPAHARLTTPMPGSGLHTPLPQLAQLAPQSGVGLPGLDPRSSSHPSYRTPAPGEVRHGIRASRLILIALGAVAVGVAAFFGYRALLVPQHGRRVVEQPASPGGTTQPGEPAGGGTGTAGGLTVEPIPEKVNISIDSQPSGAQVFVAGESAPRGVTPLTIQLDHGDSAVDLVLKAEGYEDKRARVVPSENRRFDLQLTAASPSEAGDAAGDKAGDKAADKDGDKGDGEAKKGSDRASSDGDKKGRDRDRHHRDHKGSGDRSRGGKSGKGDGENPTQVGDGVLRPDL